MPNRIIKESICTSDSLDQLGWFEEVLFYRLIVNCDDYGRFDGRTAVIKNRLFPLKENLTMKNVASAINKLARAGLVTLYESDGKPFLFLPSWNEHQNVRAKKSKYPEPVNICMQMISDDGKCPRNPIQSESNPNPIRIQSESNPNPSAQARVEEAFDKFWSCYPRKENEKKAFEAFKKVTAPLETLLEALEAQKKSDQWQKNNGQFIPHPTTWLNGERWKDTLQTSQASGGKRELDSDEVAAIMRMMGDDGAGAGRA